MAQNQGPPRRSSRIRERDERREQANVLAAQAAAGQDLADRQARTAALDNRHRRETEDIERERGNVEGDLIQRELAIETINNQHADERDALELHMNDRERARLRQIQNRGRRNGLSARELNLAGLDFQRRQVPIRSRRIQTLFRQQLRQVREAQQGMPELQGRVAELRYRETQVTARQATEVHMHRQQLAAEYRLPAVVLPIPRSLETVIARAEPVADAINGLLSLEDRRNLMLALPPRPRTYMDAIFPRGLDYRCQNRAVEWPECNQHPINNNLFQIDTKENQILDRCYQPRHLQGELKGCQGEEMGLEPDHGKDRWVCQFCADVGWERFALDVKPRAIDLCWDDSVKYVRRLNGWGKCRCLGDHGPGSQRTFHLCHDCRLKHSRNKEQMILDFIRATHMAPMHRPAAAPANQPDRISDYINETSPLGESTCTCGKTPAQKTASITVGQTMQDITNAQFRDSMVRLCLNCQNRRMPYRNDRA